MFSRTKFAFWLWLLFLLIPYILVGAFFIGTYSYEEWRQSGSPSGMVRCFLNEYCGEDFMWELYEETNRWRVHYYGYAVGKTYCDNNERYRSIHLSFNEGRVKGARYKQEDSLYQSLPKKQLTPEDACQLLEESRECLACVAGNRERTRNFRKFINFVEDERFILPLILWAPGYLVFTFLLGMLGSFAWRRRPAQTTLVHQHRKFWILSGDIAICIFVVLILFVFGALGFVGIDSAPSSGSMRTWWLSLFIQAFTILWSYLILRKDRGISLRWLVGGLAIISLFVPLGRNPYVLYLPLLVLIVVQWYIFAKSREELKKIKSFVIPFAGTLVINAIAFVPFRGPPGDSSGTVSRLMQNQYTFLNVSHAAIASFAFIWTYLYYIEQKASGERQKRIFHILRFTTAFAFFSLLFPDPAAHTLFSVAVVIAVLLWTKFSESRQLSADEPPVDSPLGATKIQSPPPINQA